MQKLFIVRSEHFIPEFNSVASYTWSVYRRPAPVVAYEDVIKDYCEQAYRQLAARCQGSDLIVADELLTLQVARQKVDRLFSEEEARELAALLPLIHPEMKVTLEEVELPVLKPDYSFCALDNFNALGSFVCPEDFAEITGQSLAFEVMAAISFQSCYTAEDFLNNLSPARLAALRKMHAECNG